MKNILRISALIGLSMGVPSGPALALSQIATELFNAYGITVPGSCNGCHLGSTSSNTFNPGWPSSMNDYMDGAGSALNPSTPADIIAAIEYVELHSNYSPYVLESNRLQTPNGDAVSAVIPIEPGKNFDGSAGTLSTVNSSWDVAQGSVAKTSGLNSATITFTNESANWRARGDRRRANVLANGSCSAANPDYTLTLDPVNTASYSPTNLAVIANNSVAFCFGNISPVPGAATKFINVLEGSSMATLVGGSAASNVLTDSFPDIDPDGNTAINLEAVLITPPAASGFSLLADGSFTYTADDYSVRATDSFQYRVRDSEGATSAEIVTVEIVIIENVGGNSAPIALDDSATVAENASNVSVDVLLNDFDNDGDTYSVTGIGSVSGPGSATIAGGGAAILVTPDTNSDQPFTIVYQVSDEHGLSASATLVVSIAGAENDPVANAILISPNPEDDDPEFTVNLLDPTYVSDPDAGAVLSVVETSINVAITNFVDLAVPAGFDLAFSISAGVLTVDPTRFDFVDQGDVAELEFHYTISDETMRTVTNKVVVYVVGLANEPFRIPGQYSDSLSSRYNNHFENGSAAPGACLSCHLPNRVGQTVELNCTTNDGGFNNEPVFNSFGLAICQARDPAKEALSDLVERLAAQEVTYAPQLATVGAVNIDEDLEEGEPVVLVSASSPGLNVFAETTSIVTYLFNDNGAYRDTAQSGMFKIDDSGQISVAGPLSPGDYQIDVRPVNDASQQNNSGAVTPGIPGFFPVSASLVTPKIFTIAVDAVPVVAVADTANVEDGGRVVIDVAVNDTGGEVRRVEVGNAPSNGGAADNGSAKTITYTPSGGFTGADSFEYIAFNADDLPSNSATVSINVVASGGLVAVNDEQSVAPGVDTVIDVLANDGNAIRSTSDPINATIVSLVGAPSNPIGTFVASGQNVVFTPNVGVTSGSTTISYEGSNPSIPNSTSAATITVTITEFDPDSGIGASSIPKLAEMATAFLNSCEYVGSNGSTSPDTDAFMNVCVNIQTAIDNGENVDQAMRALRNEEHFAALDSTMVIARGLGNVVQNRISQIQRGETRGVDLSGISASVNGVEIPSRSLQDLGEAVLGIPGQAEEDAYGGQTPWGLFIAGEFVYGQQDASDTESAFELTSNNLMIGLDYQVSEVKIVGMSVGYATSDVDFGDGGSISGQGLQISGFAALDDFRRPGVQLDGYVSIGRVAFNSDRAISFTNNGVTVDEIANAQFNSTYINIAPRLSFSKVQGEYGDPIGRPETDLQLTLFGGLDYLFTYIDGYTEEGGGGLDLDVNGQGYHSLIVSLGVEFDRTLYIGSTKKFRFFGGVAAHGELLDGNRSVTSSFVVAGPGAPSFTITEPGTQGLFLTADVGATFEVGAGNLSLAYGLEQHSGNQLNLQRFSVQYRTPIGRSGSLLLGGGQAISQNGSDWTTEAQYSMEF